MGPRVLEWDQKGKEAEAVEEFSERLKRCRKEKGLTQQELADQLGVSNKTVSRWESGGGYPDVPLLVPLARALGVTADDLLDGEKPIRTLTRGDYQTLLSFAFALGGGVLYFLTDLFMPALVCYLAYLACMAYGVYLQRYYSFQSRWFRLGNAVMDLAVNLSLLGGLAVSALAYLRGADLAMLLMDQKWRLILIGTVAVVGGALTAVTVILVDRLGFGKGGPGPRLVLRRPRPSALIPAAGVLCLLAFWVAYDRMPVDVERYEVQMPVYYGLMGALALVCVLASCRKGRRWGLVPTAAMVGGGLCLPMLAVRYVWLPTSKKIMVDNGVVSERYMRFFGISGELIAAAVVVIVVCVLLSMLRVETRETDKGT